MNISKYLDRINYKGELRPELDVLKELQSTHLLHIPFENLDIHYKIPIHLSIDRIYEKIIHQGRGGFCYELNGLFFELLSAIGFEAKRVSARVYNKEKGYGQEFDHMAIVVKINADEYLTDVGFGEFTFGPLVLKEGLVQCDERGVFQVDRIEDEYLRVSKIEERQTLPEYIFKNVKRTFDEFRPMCLYHQTSSASHFTHKKIITRPTDNGRVTLTEKNLKITRAGVVVKNTEILREMFAENLATYFLISEAEIKG